jgi:hypothetical protein
MGKKTQGCVSVGLAKGLAADPFGLSAIYPGMDRRLLARRPADPSSLAVERYHEQRARPASQPCFPRLLERSGCRRSGCREDDDLKRRIATTQVE